jgi:four helix bundle protein
MLACKKSGMNERDLKLRTKKFAVDILKLVDRLPKTRSGNIIGGQLGRCGTSVAANYRATCRGRSNDEFIAKLGVVEEEADESTFWLDILPASGNATVEEISPLLKESRELTAIFTSSCKTAKQNRAKKRKEKKPPKGKDPPK